MALTISPNLITDPSTGTLSAAFRDIGSAATGVVAAGGAISATRDHMALRSGALLSAQAAGHRQGIDNAAKAVSLLQVAGSALDEIDSRLARMKQLAADASQTSLSATNLAPQHVSSRDRAVFNAEFTALRAEIDAIAGGTSFDGLTLFTDLSLDIALGGGGTSSDSITVALQKVASGDLAAGLDSDSLLTQASAVTALANINVAIDTLGAQREAVSSTLDRFGYATNNLEFGAAVADAERTRRLTPEVTLDTSMLVSGQLLDQRGIDPSTHDSNLNRALLERITTITMPDTDVGETDDPADGTASAPAATAAPVRAPQPQPSEPQDPSSSVTA